MKKIMTVAGPVNPSDLGITLPHEHLLWNNIGYLESTRKSGEIGKHNIPMTLENHGDVVMRSHFYTEDLVMTDVDLAIEEAMSFKRAGGKTIVELSPIQWRDPEAYYEIAAVTGLNIIFGSANYISPTWSEEERQRTAEDIKNNVISEFLDGIGFLKLKPGIIGEIGIFDMGPLDIISLQGSAMAQKEIGCAINVHPTLFYADGSHGKDGNKILDVIQEAGGDVQKVCMSHNDLCYYDIEYLDSMAKRGAYIEFDQFGMYAMTMSAMPGKYLPSDLHRCTAIKQLIDLGHLDKILISQDICYKHLMKKYGGYGYAHILRNIVPMLRDYAGIPEEHIHKMLVDNPINLISF